MRKFSSIRNITHLSHVICGAVGQNADTWSRGESQAELHGMFAGSILHETRDSGSKQSRTTVSATSRKNKLQRCSTCGLLGHKSRTCEYAASKLASADDMEFEDSKLVDSSKLVAAYSLLNLSTSHLGRSELAGWPWTDPASTNYQNWCGAQLMDGLKV